MFYNNLYVFGFNPQCKTTSVYLTPMPTLSTSASFKKALSYNLVAKKEKYLMILLYFTKLLQFSL